MPSEMPFEDELTDALHSTATAFEPDLTSLVNSGLGEGRRRSRRRTLGVVGGVTALALVGIGGAAASGVLGAGPGPALAGPAAQTATRAATAGATPPPYEPGFTAQQMLSSFEARLPGGTVTGARSTGFTQQQKAPKGWSVSGPTASLVLTDAKGSSTIGITVSRPAGSIHDPQLQDYVTCPTPAERPDITCTRTGLPDGSVLAITQGLENPHGPGQEKDWTAWLATKDGGLIELDETNAASEKGAPSRPVPILTPARLKSIVTYPLWSQLASKLPALVPVYRTDDASALPVRTAGH